MAQSGQGAAFAARRWRARLTLAAVSVLGLAGLVPAVLSALSGAGAAGGSGWQATQLPLPAGGQGDGTGYAGPIACPAVGGCVVLGEYATPAGLDEDMIDTESGGTWSSAEAPLPPGGTQAANLGPYALRCTGVGDCLGSSVYQTATSVAADILWEESGTWSALAMPLPADASPTTIASVNGLACPLEGACVIVGSYLTASGLSEGLVVTQEGKRFVTAEAPTPGGANKGSTLEGVACTSPSACVGVGYYVSASGSREPLVVTDAAGALAAATPPLPTGAAENPEASLSAVSCASTSGCVALGSYESPAGDQLGVIDTDSGGRFGAGTMPVPAGASTSSPAPAIFGLVCKGGDYCLGVGRYVEASGAAEGLALLQQAGRWSATMMPGTAGTGVIVRAVSCVSATSCAAAGNYYLAARSAEVGYLLTLSGSTLSGATSPVPADAAGDPAVQLGFVSCPWIATCVATGTYAGGGSPPVELPFVVGD